MSVTFTNPLRRLTLMVLAALIICSGLGLSPGRADALVPGAPRLVGPIGWDEEVLVGWSLPFTGGKHATGYTVERYKGDAAQPEKTYQVGGSTMWLVDKGVKNNTVYKYRVKAKNADGESGWSPTEAVQPKPFRLHLAPFEDADAFVKRQYHDLLGRAPSASELAAGKALVANDYSAKLTDQLAHTPARVAERHPVIRLYFAFFERSPDVGGANYWIAKRKGGMNLNTIASKFAGSAEFTNTYGPLSNSDFVKLVYQNVLDRPADADGLTYWTNKLNNGTATRGKVMVGFSESSEYAGSNGAVGLSTGRVEASDIWMAVMKAVPTDNGLKTYYAPHIQEGGSQGSLAMLLMPTNSYPK